MYHYWALFTLIWHYLGYFDVIRIQIWICEPECRFLSGWTQIYQTYCYVLLLSLICPKIALFGLFWCNPDPDLDLWTRCRLWSGWTQIYQTYCNVASLALICCKMALFGLFCCNPDPNLDFWCTCRFWFGWNQIYLTYCKAPLCGLICCKMP